ncbi:MAG: alpha-amylase family glycosyl hydrolase, partial [Candidatus Omnitrophica bacterium]|nr:alpha-amylase family glycosyl hydrolase [Candidatus Omnitrophota bacterium]
MNTTKPALPTELSPFTEDDLRLFRQGRHCGLYEKLGAHPSTRENEAGTWFGLWAPNAERVSVIGEFNQWNPSDHPLEMDNRSRVWSGFIPRVGQGTMYKYHVVSRFRGFQVDKADPFGYRQETPPGTASLVWNLGYQWKDQAWMGERGRRFGLGAPVSIYEMHLGSWRRVPEERSRWLSSREIAPLLVEHMQRLGFTHVEFLPLMEHPFYGSWGYQATGYFAPTSRYGTPQDLMYLVDTLHQNGLGVIFDWVPSHFPTDEHGLAYFDGTHLYEHPDMRKGHQPDWNSYVFNYG